MKRNFDNKFKKFAKNLKSQMQKKGLNVSELASKAKIRKQYLNKILNAKAQGLMLSHVEKLLEALDIEPKDLLK